MDATLGEPDSVDYYIEDDLVRKELGILIRVS
jgi:hypothetical protein